MGAEKKLIRKNFRDACYRRDKYKCVKCCFTSSPDKAEAELDAHHITDRREMPNGGYVKENGISLCTECHIKAEQYHSTGEAVPGYSIEELYVVINSTLEKAIEASKKLSD
jgi:5-methylcytosine-specific restriction endonuclease McrA